MRALPIRWRRADRVTLIRNGPPIVSDPNINVEQKADSCRWSAHVGEHAGGFADAYVALGSLDGDGVAEGLPAAAINAEPDLVRHVDAGVEGAVGVGPGVGDVGGGVRPAGGRGGLGGASP